MRRPEGEGRREEEEEGGQGWFSAAIADCSSRGNTKD